MRAPHRNASTVLLMTGFIVAYVVISVIIVGTTFKDTFTSSNSYILRKQ